MSIKASAQFRFSHLGISNGLSQNSVHCIFQDSQGFIWIGTQDGLNRYDAYSFRTFRHNKNDTISLSDNFITGIEEDTAHNLWIATRNGMNRFDRRTEKFERIFPDGMDKNYFHNSIRHIFKDKKGDIYFDSHGNFYCIKILSTGTIYKIEKLARGYPVGQNFGIDKDENLITTDSTGLWKFSADHTNYTGPERIFSNKIFSIADQTSPVFVDRENRCWVACGNKALCYDISGKLFFQTEIADAVYGCIAEDAGGNIWIGGDRGLVILDHSGKAIGTAVNKPGSSSSLGGNNVLCIYPDRSGAIWIGTSEGGVNYYNPFQDVFMTCRKEEDDEKSISDNGTWTIFQDGKKLFVGTSSGLNIFTLKKENFSGVRSFGDNVVSRIFIDKDFLGKPLSNITSVVEPEENVYWVATRSNGILIMDGSGKYFTQVVDDPDFLASNTVFNLVMAKDGTIWISTINGLSHFDFKSKNMETFRHDANDPNSLAGNYVISSYEDKAGKIWSSTTAGLSCYDPLTKKFHNYISAYNDKKSLSYNIVTSCLQDSKGRLWVTTLGGGINLFDPATNGFKTYSQEEGLSNGVVYGVSEDAHGDLWMSSNAGISCFHPETETFVNYFPNDGIISNEYSQNGFFKNASGEIFFASPEGLLLFNPSSLGKKKTDPPVILTSYAVNYSSRNAFPVAEAGSLDLVWSEKTISFEFAALDYSSADKISYSYKLDGFDNDWVNAGPGQRIATYTSLPFGNYIFKVRIRKPGGEWSKEYLNIAAHVIPPFWYSWWFVLCEAIVGLVLLILVIRYYAQRKLRIQLRKIEVEQKLQHERERISRDLHDNVGAHLTYIIQSLDNISFRIEKAPADKSVAKIDSLGEFARGTMQQLRETIWAINTEEIRVSALRDKIRDHLDRLKAAVSGINFSVELVTEKEIVLKPSQAIHIFRLVQESINNAVKHAGATSVSVKISCRKRTLLISVTDDGKGFDAGEKFDGHYGLVNMQSRVEEMGGKLEIISAPGKGTAVNFEVPS